jgi:hypothetical protein
MPEWKASSQNYISAIIIALLAAYGIGGSVLTSKPNASGEGSKRPLTARKIGDETQQQFPHSAVSMLETFLGTTPIQENDERPWLSYSHPRKRPKKRLAHTPNPNNRPSQSVEFLIATLPSPASPVLRSEFDNALDAIISAADDQHYNLDSFDLPWAAADSDVGADKSSELDIYRSIKDKGKKTPLYQLKAGTELGPRWATQPGLLLFRPEGETSPLLVAFIVGETPTQGINKLAMTDALDQIAWLWNIGPATKHPPNWDNLPDTKSKSNELKIVGPYFSGSAASMRNELAIWTEQLNEKNLIRGPIRLKYFDASATGDDAIKLFQGKANCLDWMTKSFETLPTELSSATSAFIKSSFPKGLFPSDSEPICSDVPDGLAFSMPDKDRWNLILDSLLKDWANRPPSNTNAWSQRIALLSEESAYGAGDPCQTFLGLNCKQNDPFTYMPYPLQISDLRTAFEQNKSTQAAGRPAIGPQDVPESDEGSAGRGDVPADFSTRSASYDQIMLNGLLKEVRLNNTPYIGIMASDVADLIFLSEQIRVADPDAMVFTLSADARMLRRAINPDMYGMLIFSTYPLNPDPDYARWWMKDIGPAYGDHRLREFPSEAAEAVYYAAKSAIADTSGQTYPTKLSHFLWTSIIGHDQFWPINVQSADRTEPKPSDIEYPPAFILLYLVVTLIGGGTALLYLFPVKLRPAWFDHLLGHNERLPQLYKPLYVAILFIGLLTGWLVITSYFALPFNLSHRPDRLPRVVLCANSVVILPLLLSGTLRSLLTVIGPLLKPPEWPMLIGLALVVAIIWHEWRAPKTWMCMECPVPGFVQKAIFMMLLVVASSVLACVIIAVCSEATLVDWPRLPLVISIIPLSFWLYYTLTAHRSEVSDSLLFMRSASIGSGYLI